MELTEAQLTAFNSVLSGHNLLLLGSAGTGKSFLLKKIVAALTAKGKTVALTATTGIACSVYNDACTIHKWSGIGDGRHQPCDIAHVILNNAQYSEVRQRIQQVDVLIVDECSMLSKKMFDSLNEVCMLKNPDRSKHFGGIQLLFSGDFKQLSPVPNKFYAEEGEFCFKSKLFDDVFQHHVTLTEVKRQSEDDLIKVINDAASGKMSAESENYIQQLSRPIATRTDTVKLFSKNEQVDEYNRSMILQFPGELYELQGTDEGETKYLSSLTVPKILWLKEGAPVILLRNLSDKLVNGLQGYVKEMTENGPVVHFPSVDAIIPLEQMKFSVFSPSRNTDLASRLQYPLKLSFAITIHKSQGLTLNSVEIDCRQIFKPGQLGVALGRARESAHLRVINFSKRCVIPQPASIMKFLERPSAEFKDDLTCCSQRVQRCDEPEASKTDFFTVGDIRTSEEAVEVNDEQQIMEDFDQEFDEVIGMMNNSQFDSVQLPVDLDLKSILESVECPIVKTPMQYSINSILKEIDHSKYTQFVKGEYSKLYTFIEELKVDPTKPVPSSTLSAFYAKVHAYQTGAEFRMKCLIFFENEQFTENHLHICFCISNKIRTYLLEKKAELFPAGSRKLYDRSVTEASEPRVRYVGGYCVAKVRHKCMQKKQSHMYKTDPLSQEVYNESILAVTILDSLRVEEHYILASTQNPASLLDVLRKQGVNRGLTNISDELFNFFSVLTEKCLSLLVDENLSKFGTGLFEELRNKLHQDSKLQSTFSEVVKQSVSSYEEFATPSSQMFESVLENVFTKIIKLFLTVMLNQFRKDVLNAMKVEKKMAHRKQVQVSSKKGKTSKSKNVGAGSADISLPSTSKDSAGSADISLPSTSKDSAGSADISLPSTSKDSAGSADISLPSTSTKKRKVGDSDTSDDDWDDDREVGGGSKTEGSVETAAGGDSLSDDDDDAVCQVCSLNQSQAPNLIDWIKCDKCKSWLHRKCAGLQHHLRWKKMNRADVKFVCKKCE